MTLTCPSTCPAPNRTTVAPPSSHHCYLGLSTLCCSWLSASCLVHRFLQHGLSACRQPSHLAFLLPCGSVPPDMRPSLHMLLFSLAGRRGGSSWGLPGGSAQLAAASSNGTFAPASRFEVGCKLANAWSAQPRRETGSHSKRSSIGVREVKIPAQRHPSP